MVSPGPSGFGLASGGGPSEEQRGQEETDRSRVFPLCSLHVSVQGSSNGCVPKPWFALAPFSIAHWTHPLVLVLRGGTSPGRPSGYR